MSGWTAKNIGDIILYKSKSEFGGEKNEKIAIYSADERVPNTVRFVEYPIKFNSKIGLVGLDMNQEKESEEYIKEAGDWCFLGMVSKDEMGELERIAKAPKVPLNEDLMSWDKFHSYPPLD